MEGNDFFRRLNWSVFIRTGYGLCGHVPMTRSKARANDSIRHVSVSFYTDFQKWRRVFYRRRGHGIGNWYCQAICGRSLFS